LASALNDKDFFLARDLYAQYQSNMPGFDRLLFQAELMAAFNQPDSSNKALECLLNDHKAQLTDSLLIAATEMQQANFVRLFQYQAAAATGEKLLVMDLSSEKREDVKNTNIIWKALANEPAQQLRLTPTELSLTRDKAQLRNLTVQANGKALPMIFDTGANLSVATQSTATALGMKLLDGTVQVTAITGTKVSSKVAVCPSLTIGTLKIQHAVFLVMPDSALAFPQADYQIHGIIGFPVIEALGAVTITTDDRFIVGKIKNGAALKNFALDFLTPIIRLDAKPYTFDTGANTTILYPSYFNQHRQEIIATYQPSEINFAGA
jgi:predicted aspartyl protease